MCQRSCFIWQLTEAESTTRICVQVVHWEVILENTGRAVGKWDREETAAIYPCGDWSWIPLLDSGRQNMHHSSLHWQARWLGHLLTIPIFHWLMAASEVTTTIPSKQPLPGRGKCTWVHHRYLCARFPWAGRRPLDGNLEVSNHRAEEGASVMEGRMPKSRDGRNTAQSVVGMEFTWACGSPWPGNPKGHSCVASYCVCVVWLVPLLWQLLNIVNTLCAEVSVFFSVAMKIESEFHVTAVCNLWNPTWKLLIFCWWGNYRMKSDSEKGVKPWCQHSGVSVSSLQCNCGWILSGAKV